LHQHEPRIIGGAPGNAVLWRGRWDSSALLKTEVQRFVASKVTFFRPNQADKKSCAHCCAQLVLATMQCGREKHRGADPRYFQCDRTGRNQRFSGQQPRDERFAEAQHWRHYTYQDIH